MIQHLSLQQHITFGHQPREEAKSTKKEVMYFIAEGAAETAHLIETISNVGNIYFTKF